MENMHKRENKSNFFSKNYKMIIGFIICIMLTSCVTAYATSYLASKVTYKDGKTVEQSLNELYQKGKTANVWNNGNPLNLILYNGCEIRKDEEGDYYLYFDGVDDYAQLDTLPSSINWKGGFSVEVTAKWDAFNWWSRIFDFGNASVDAIALANYQSSSNFNFLFEDGSNQYGENLSTSLDTTNKINYKIRLDSNGGNSYTVTTIKNGVNEKEETFSANIININRTKNYLGKSNYPDGYFKGRIYKLKIDQADGTNIIDIDVNKLF